MNQLNLFPTRDTLEQVEQEALAMLPITSENQLLAVLRMAENTILNGQPVELD